MWKQGLLRRWWSSLSNQKLHQSPVLKRLSLLEQLLRQRRSKQALWSMLFRLALLGNRTKSSSQSKLEVRQRRWRWRWLPALHRMMAVRRLLSKEQQGNRKPLLLYQQELLVRQMCQTQVHRRKEQIQLLSQQTLVRRRKWLIQLPGHQRMQVQPTGRPTIQKRMSLL